MSGSAKKRREKARQRERRKRAKTHKAAWRALFRVWEPSPRLVDMPHDRVPGFIHDIEFAAFTDPTRHIYAGG